MGTKSRGLMKTLTPRHELFCLHRMRGATYAEAYLAAGFKSSPINAKKEGWHLEREPPVAARMAELWAEKFKALHMSVDEVLARTAMLARTDAAALLDADGCVQNLADLPKEATVMVAGVEVTEEFETVGKKRVKVGQKTKVRLRDPAPFIRLLAEHHKIVKAPEEGMNALASAIADRLKAARERKRKENSPS